MTSPGAARHLAPPSTRSLRVYAFDPTIGRRYGNHMTVEIPYERGLKPGPRGRLVEVIDYDPLNKRYYRPVDLDERNILVQDGVAPTEADPWFHQQMVYAVAMKTIENFSFALGRPIEWRRRDRKGNEKDRPQPLRVFPHALQEANAYYDANLHALLFGYFTATAGDSFVNAPGQTVFSCLSHDIVAHETTHALIHSVRHHFMEPTGPDTLAFHEAFADIVALFQHFTFHEAVLDHIRRTGGVLHRPNLNPLSGDGSAASASTSSDKQEDPDAPYGIRQGASLRPATMAEEAQRNVLVGLARQFGEAMGMRAALREALGSPADPAELGRRFEPHARGAILVAAVFDAFFTVYAQRMRDLFQIAPSGAGAGGELGHELASRLCAEATKTAGHFVNMCIRALDYCPPVDISFGDFLRALITADSDLVKDDDRGYRDIIIDAFRRRGIRPGDAASYSEPALRWEPPERPLVCKDLRFDVIWGTSKKVLAHNATALNRFARNNAKHLKLEPPSGGVNKIQPLSFHPVHRVGPDGQLTFNIVAELVQQCTVPLDPRRKSSPDIVFRGGTTVIFDAPSGVVRYAIYKPLGKPLAQTKTKQRRLERQREFWSDWADNAAGAFRSSDEVTPRADFAALHRGY